jgi:peroxiredoxin
MTPVEVGDRAPDPVVFDPDGREVALSSCWRHRPAVLVFLRHYG